MPRRIRKELPRERERVVIVFDGEGWFIRRLKTSEHDLTKDEMVYRCDKAIGNDYGSLDAAVYAFQDWKRRKGAKWLKKICR